MTTATAIFALVALTALVWAIRDFRRNSVRPRQLLVAWYGVYFGLVPPFVLMDRSYWSPRFYRSFSPDSFAFSAWLSLLGLVVLLLVFGLSGGKPRVSRTEEIEEAAQDGRPTQTTSRMRVLLFTGLLAVATSITLNGGLSEVIGRISELRSTSGGSGRRVLAAALMLGRHWILLAAIYFSLDYKLGDRLRSSRNFAMIAWAVSIFLALISGGRATAINVLIAGLLTTQLASRKIRPIQAIGVAAVAFFMILYGKTILFQLGNDDFSSRDADAVLSRTQSEGQLTVFIREFTHPYLSLVQSVQLDYQQRLFGDYWYWAAKPFKLLGMSPPDSISYFNTYLTWGQWDSEVPPGLLAFGFLSLGTLGVVIHAAVAAFLVSVLERILYAGSLLGKAMGVQAAIIVPTLVSASDPALLFQNYFVLGIPLLWVLGYRQQLRRADAKAHRTRVRQSATRGPRPHARGRQLSRSGVSGS
ncbi:hypothetical protein [Janibacter anophelis]|uniref:hypothetical protein n=1 Tax=Janibacter anophelis TaxID=319054 RepID=UPI000DEFD961|nr:hypothetical protein [Janibacter anophelis]